MQTTKQAQPCTTHNTVYLAANQAQLQEAVTTVIRQHRAEQYRRGLIIQTSIVKLCERLILLPYAQTQGQIKPIAEPLFKHIERYNRATKNTTLYEIQQVNALLHQAAQYHAAGMENLPKRQGKPLGIIIKGIYAELYRWFQIDAELGEIRKITALIAPFDYADSQINDHLTPAARREIKARIDAQKWTDRQIETAQNIAQVHLAPLTPPESQAILQSDSEKLRAAIALIESTQIEHGDKTALIGEISQTALVYGIALN